MLMLFVQMAVALGLLIGGAEALVRGGSALAVRMGVSSFFVGLTIVAFGTSAPELATGVASVVRGAGDLTVGNVVGASIYNVAVILGVSAIIAPIVIHLPTVRVEVQWVIGASMLPLAGWLFGGVLPRWFGAGMLALLVVFIWRAYRVGKSSGELEAPPGDAGVRPRPGRVWLELGLVLAGLGLLVVGSNLLVEASVQLARLMGLSELVIGLTIVSFGTASPELVTSIVAAFKGRSEIAVGNVLGSNIFNILGILGLTTVIRPPTLSAQTLSLDLPVLVLATLSLLPIMTRLSRITRGEGLILVIGYVAYGVVVFRFAPGWF
jgi:cation:H+ antiporter